MNFVANMRRKQFLYYYGKKKKHQRGRRTTFANARQGSETDHEQ